MSMVLCSKLANEVTC